ncbi:hypothetical protein PG993_013140 [Apiospora rasikravindrae]|uniref:Uncharacterized protein n=1 Tax=Apiospora rasikravindrae TaxID=990691 RepID=A0ABR1RX89_9PEZI
MKSRLVQEAEDKVKDPNGETGETSEQQFLWCLLPYKTHSSIFLRYLPPFFHPPTEPRDIPDATKDAGISLTIQKWRQCPHRRPALVEPLTEHTWADAMPLGFPLLVVRQSPHTSVVGALMAGYHRLPSESESKLEESRSQRYFEVISSVTHILNHIRILSPVLHV